MKRLFLFTAILLVVCCNIVYSKSNMRILLNESFNNYATNSLPSLASVSGGLNSRVIEIEKGNKALLLHSAGDYVRSTFTWNASAKKAFVGFKVKFDKSEDCQIVLSDSVGSKYTVLKVDSNGNLNTGDGKVIQLNISRAFENVTLEIDCRHKKYSIYIDNQIILSKWYCRDMQLKDLSSITFDFLPFADRESSYIIDNIWAYESDRITKVLPAKSYSNAVEPFEERGAFEVGNAQYASFDFENASNPFSNLVLNSKSNSIERVYDVDSGSYCVEVVKSISDPHIDCSITNPAKNLVVSLDFKYDKIGSNINLFTMVFSNVNGNVDDLYLSPGGALFTYDGTKICQMEQGEWHRLAKVNNFGRMTFDFYYNGAKVLSNYPMNIRNATGLRMTRIYMPNSLNESVFRFDNYRVYEGIVPEYLKEEVQYE